MKRRIGQDGFPINVVDRCIRYSKDGRQIKGQVVIVAFRDDGLVAIENMKTLAEGFAHPEQLRSLLTKGETPRNVLQYQLAAESRRQASEISKKRRRKGAR